MWTGMCIMDLQILFKLFKEQGACMLAMVLFKIKEMATKRLYGHKDNWLVQWVLGLNWDNLKIKTNLADRKIDIKWRDNEEYIHIA